MIHGHTHRPARHELVVGGAPALRWVLPDWYEARHLLDAAAVGHLRARAAAGQS